jgi:hypothetical protein
MRAADEKLDERILTKSEKTMKELKESKISLHQWQELCVAGVLERNKMQAIINLNPFVQDIRTRVEEKNKIQNRIKKIFNK